MSDIVARIGGDEFAVVVVEAGERSGELLTVRLQERLDVCNARDQSRFRLALSLGIVEFDQHPASLEALMAKADEALYAHKRSKRKS